jgi:hypothetical protein
VTVRPSPCADDSRHSGCTGQTECMTNGHGDASNRLIEQRVRNRIIEYPELAASFEDQRRYERDAPIAHVPYEVINQWDDQVWTPPSENPYNLDIYDAAEVEALCRYREVLEAVSRAVPDDSGRLRGRHWHAIPLRLPRMPSLEASDSPRCCEEVLARWLNLRGRSSHFASVLAGSRADSLFPLVGRSAHRQRQLRTVRARLLGAPAGVSRSHRPGRGSSRRRRAVLMES